MWYGKPSFNVFRSSASKFEYLQLQLIEVSVQNDDDIDNVLWEREKYWQAQLFTLNHGLNNPHEWYALNRRGYRIYFYWFIIFLNLIRSISLYLIMKCINEIIILKWSRTQVQKLRRKKKYYVIAKKLYFLLTWC